MSLLGRLTHDEEPSIGIHSFDAGLSEYARGEINASTLSSVFSIDGGDTQGLAIKGLIDTEIGSDAKLSKVKEIIDVLILHEDEDTRMIYPNAATIATRLNV